MTTAWRPEPATGEDSTWYIHTYTPQQTTCFPPKTFDTPVRKAAVIIFYYQNAQLRELTFIYKAINYIITS